MLYQYVRLPLDTFPRLDAEPLSLVTPVAKIFNSSIINIMDLSAIHMPCSSNFLTVITRV